MAKSDTLEDLRAKRAVFAAKLETFNTQRLSANKWLGFAALTTVTSVGLFLSRILEEYALVDKTVHNIGAAGVALTGIETTLRAVRPYQIRESMNGIDNALLAFTALPERDPEYSLSLKMAELDLEVKTWNEIKEAGRSLDPVGLDIDIQAANRLKAWYEHGLHRGGDHPEAMAVSQIVSNLLDLKITHDQAPDREMPVSLETLLGLLDKHIPLAEELRWPAYLAELLKDEESTAAISKLTPPMLVY